MDFYVKLANKFIYIEKYTSILCFKKQQRFLRLGDNGSAMKIFENEDRNKQHNGYSVIYLKISKLWSFWVFTFGIEYE